MKKYVLALAGLAAICSIALFFIPESGPIRIGYVGSISGKFSALGSAARNGAILAVETINSNGGIKGRPLELVVRDDQGDPDRTLPVCDEFAREKIQVMVGPFTTASATRLLPCINQNNILCLGPVTAGENLAKKADMFIKLFPSTSEFGAALARLALEKGITKLAVINDQRNKPFGDTLLSGFRPVYAAGKGEILSKTDYVSDRSVSHAGLADSARNGTPGGALVIASAIDTALISQQLKKRLPHIQIFVSPWSMSKELVKSGGKAVEGILAYIPFDRGSETKAYTDFKTAYLKRFKEPPPFVAAFNYEALHLLKTGLESRFSPDPVILRDTLLGIGVFKGLQADYHLDRFGDARRPLFLYEIRDSSIVKAR